MENDDELAALQKAVLTLTKAQAETQVVLTAVTTAFKGVLQALDTQPKLVPLIAEHISHLSEQMEARYLGSTMTDQGVQLRRNSLLGVLPPNMQKLVKARSQS